MPPLRANAWALCRSTGAVPRACWRNLALDLAGGLLWLRLGSGCLRRHCQYHSCLVSHESPCTQHEAPAQSLPPHCSHSPAHVPLATSGMGVHCEYHSSCAVHSCPSMQQVAPDHSTPPHCRHAAEHSPSGPGFAAGGNGAVVGPGAAVTGAHCEYQLLRRVQLEPPVQQVAPAQS